ncbi:MAG: 30S ribosomal protein S5 [bacterium]
MAEKEKEFRKRSSARPKKEKPEFDQQTVDLARVTRVMAGGKRMRFRACVVIGDHKNRVGVGLGKGKDVPIAMDKAYKKAERDMIKVNIVNGTIPHAVIAKFSASKVLLKPAPKGTGIIAGGPARLVLSMAGISDVVAKIVSTSTNKVNNVMATIEALKMLKKVNVTDRAENRFDNRKPKVAPVANKEENK